MHAVAKAAEEEINFAKNFSLENLLQKCSGLLSLAQSNESTNKTNCSLDRTTTSLL